MELLHFREVYFEKEIWGGHKLCRIFGKPAPPDKPIGEAWLIADHPKLESVVDEGPLEGRTLRQLIAADAATVLGARAQTTPDGRFPLLLKILDAADVLSVQVHPDDECARRLAESDVGKTEMWHVLDAEPGSELICGLDPSVTRETFATAIRDASIEPLMTRFPVVAADSVFVPAATVHALGAGVVVAEIQQNSDLTYRLYDWGRVQPDGTPRELHVDKALQAIHFGARHGGRVKTLTYEDGEASRTVLAVCQYFAAELVEIHGTFVRQTRGESFHILLGKSSGLRVSAGDAQRPLPPGEAVLVPGRLREFLVQGDGAFLDYYVPDIETDVAAPLHTHGHNHAAVEQLIREARKK